VRIESRQTLNEKDIYNTVWISIVKLFGECGFSQALLFLVEYNPNNKLAIFRCSHKALEMVKASIVAVTEVASEKVVFHIIRVSGTLKSLRTKAAN
jgi:RNase P/RNase MRP subunit POP5